MSQFKPNKIVDEKITNAYVLLGLARGKKYTQHEVVHVYRQKALLVHPDKNPNNPKAKERFQKLVDAIKLLLETEKFRKEKQEEKPEKKPKVPREEEAKSGALMVRDPALPTQKKVSKKGSRKWQAQNGSKAAKIRRENSANMFLRQVRVDEEDSDDDSDLDLAKPKEKRLAKDLEKHLRKDENKLRQEAAVNAEAAEEVLLTNLKRQTQTAQIVPSGKALSKNVQRQINELERVLRDRKEKKVNMPTYMDTPNSNDFTAQFVGGPLDAKREFASIFQDPFLGEDVLYSNDGVILSADKSIRAVDKHFERDSVKDQFLKEKTEKFWETRATSTSNSIYNTSSSNKYPPAHIEEAQDTHADEETHSRVKNYIKTFVESIPDNGLEDFSDEKMLARTDQPIAIPEIAEDADFSALTWHSDSSRESVENALGYPVTDAAWAAIEFVKGRGREMTHAPSKAALSNHGKNYVGRSVVAGFLNQQARKEAKVKSKAKHGGFGSMLFWWERDGREAPLYEPSYICQHLCTCCPGPAQGW